jgi:hypothetical protein
VFCERVGELASLKREEDSWSVQCFVYGRRVSAIKTYKFLTSLKNSWHEATNALAEGYFSRSSTGASAILL